MFSQVCVCSLVGKGSTSVPGVGYLWPITLLGGRIPYLSQKDYFTPHWKDDTTLLEGLP